MGIFLAKCVMTFVITMLGTTVVFCVLEVLPGDPALTILGIDAPDSAVPVFRELEQGHSAACLKLDQALKTSETGL